MHCCRAAKLSASACGAFADFLFMFEGMAQGALGANWGDGHATDADLMNLVRAAFEPKHDTRGQTLPCIPAFA